MFFEGGGGILNSEGMDYPRILNSGGVAAGGSSILSAWGLTHSPTHTHTRVLIAIPAAGAGGLDIKLGTYLGDLPIFMHILSGYAHI